jgi:hypothetical protein
MPNVLLHRAHAQHNKQTTHQAINLREGSEGCARARACHAAADRVLLLGEGSAGGAGVVCVCARARARVHLDEVKTDAWLVRKLQVKQKSRLADDWICRFI